MNTRIALALIACATFLPAQGLGGFLKKSAAPAASASKVDVGSALASGAEMITLHRSRDGMMYLRAGRGAAADWPYAMGRE